MAPNKIVKRTVPKRTKAQPIQLDLPIDALQGLNITPPPPKICPPIIPISQIIAGFRNYDGSIPAEQWLRKFRADCAAHSLDTKWARNNIDRVLCGPVKCWFSSREYSFLSPLTPQETEESRWFQIETELKETFGSSALTSQAKHKNKSIRFDPKSDPQDYVMKKLEALSQIDPAMSNPKKLKHLISGLPQSMAAPMTLALDPQTTTPNQFLNRLRAYIEIQPQFVTPVPPNQQYRPEPWQYTPPPRFDNPNANIRPLMDIKVTPPSAMPQYTPRHPAPTKQCDYCTKFGHIASECYRKARDDSRPVPQPRYNNNRGMNFFEQSPANNSEN
jgi:hypothetical protein